VKVCGSDALRAAAGASDGSAKSHIRSGCRIFFSHFSSSLLLSFSSPRPPALSAAHIGKLIETFQSFDYLRRKILRGRSRKAVVAFSPHTILFIFFPVLLSFSLPPSFFLPFIS